MDHCLRLFEVRRGESVFVLGEERTVVGRDPAQCEIVLDPLDRTASRVQFRVAKRGEHHFLEHLGKNSTFVNGEPMGSAPRRLYHGDRIEVGNAEMTFQVTGGTESVDALLAQAHALAGSDPSAAIQRYALALGQAPSSTECAAALLALLEKEGRLVSALSDDTLLPLDRVLELANDLRVAAPLARAYASTGDFGRAMSLVERAGGAAAHPDLEALVRGIEEQTGPEILATVRSRAEEIPFFQRGKLQVHIDDRADFGDLHYVERYYKYVQHRVDGPFGGSHPGTVAFYVSARDQLFARSAPGEGEILGYYSPQSKRIFVRPRRWMDDRTAAQAFPVTLLHEYVHLRVDEATGPHTIPLWFNEGLAQTLSEPEDLAAFQKLTSVATALGPLDSFPDTAFSPIHGNPALAYVHSHVVVRALVRAFGTERVIDVLHDAGRSGDAFAVCFERTLGISLAEADQRWRRTYESK